MDIFLAVVRKPKGHILKGCMFSCEKSSRYEKVT